MSSRVFRRLVIIVISVSARGSVFLQRKSQRYSRQYQAYKKRYGFKSYETHNEHWHAEERDHHKKERKYWILSFLATCIAVVFTIKTVLISNQTLHEAQVTTSAAVEAVRQASRQAKAAEDQLAEARIQTVQYKRQADAASSPFLYGRIRTNSGMWDAISDPQESKQFALQVSIENYGAGPAIIYKVSCGAFYDLGGFIFIGKDKMITKKDVPTIDVMSMSGEIHMSEPRIIAAADKEVSYNCPWGIMLNTTSIPELRRKSHVTLDAIIYISTTSIRPSLMQKLDSMSGDASMLSPCKSRIAGIKLSAR